MHKRLAIMAIRFMRHFGKRTVDIAIDTIYYDLSFLTLKILPGWWIITLYVPFMNREPYLIGRYNRRWI